MEKETQDSFIHCKKRDERRGIRDPAREFSSSQIGCWRERFNRCSASLYSFRKHNNIETLTGELHEARPSARACSWIRAYTSFAPFNSSAMSLIPTPGPLGTDILPLFTLIGGSNQLAYFSKPSLYS